MASTNRSDARRAPSIACFGEALWDVLPRGIFLGGAPLNVAYHLSRLGVEAVPITSVGRDFLGDEVLRRIGAWKVETRGVSRSAASPTGTVLARLDRRGKATYDIRRHVAWDHIEAPARLRALPAPRAIVFGSLALRSPSNRAALNRLFELWPDALRVADLNLRPPFDSGPGIAMPLRAAHLVKLNNEELARLTARRCTDARSLEAAARVLVNQHAFRRLCVTAGPRGAGLLWDGAWHWEHGRTVVVRDTIGAGDAFLAGFLAAQLKRRQPPEAALASACRLGEFVASQDGATPSYRCDAGGRPVAG